MHSAAVIASLFSILALTNAQAGRFPCTTTILGVPTLDQSLCATLTPTGLDQGVSFFIPRRVDFFSDFPPLGDPHRLQG